jgi:hypothetical protein
MDPYPILYIEHGVAYIPMWQWDTSREEIFGYPVAASVIAVRPVPNNGHVRVPQTDRQSAAPTLLLDFANGWTAAVGFNTDHPMYSAPAPGVYMARSATATIFARQVADSRHAEAREQTPVESLDDLLRTIRAVADRAPAVTHA